MEGQQPLTEIERNAKLKARLKRYLGGRGTNCVVVDEHGVGSTITIPSFSMNERIRSQEEKD